MRLWLHLRQKTEHMRALHAITTRPTAKKTSMKLETLPLAPAHPTVRRRWRAPAAGLVALALAGAGFAYLQQPKAKPAPAAAAEAGKGAPKVDAYELASGDVATVEARVLSVNLPLSGSLAPLTQATIKAKVSGVVQDTAVQEGMAVTAGQVIARLDGAELQARVAQQQATLDEANARLALARKNNANSAALLKQNFISQNAYDTTQNSVELAQASAKAAQAQLEMARIALADTVIRAPLSGVISKRHVQAGEKLAPDMPVFSIVNLQQLTLEAQVPASEIPRVKVGQEVRFKVDGYRERVFVGKVTRINPATEAGSRSMLVYISVDNADAALRAGMFAKGAITTEKSQAMPLVPLSAVRKENQQDVVFKIEGGKVVAQQVTLGLRNEDEGMAEVTAGLAPGARVIVTQLDEVKPGSKVKLAKPAAGAALKG
jgi:membrane fusion protein (multidrug efflux system)